MTRQDEDINAIRAMLNKCVIFAASDMCKKGDLEEALRDFGLVEAGEAQDAFERIIGK